MIYNISYECSSGEKVFQGNFEIKSQETPKATDLSVRELALRDSGKFLQAGQVAGIRIIDIVLKEKL